MSNFLTDVITSPKIKKLRTEKKKQILDLLDLSLKIKIPYPMKKIYNCCIPPNIFQTWHSKTLPPLMLDAVNKIKKINPRFNYQLFDDNDCRNFIQNNLILLFFFYYMVSYLLFFALSSHSVNCRRS